MDPSINYIQAGICFKVFFQFALFWYIQSASNTCAKFVFLGKIPPVRYADWQNTECPFVRLINSFHMKCKRYHLAWRMSLSVWTMFYQTVHQPPYRSVPICVYSPFPEKNLWSQVHPYSLQSLESVAPRNKKEAKMDISCMMFPNTCINLNTQTRKINKQDIYCISQNLPP